MDTFSLEEGVVGGMAGSEVGSCGRGNSGVIPAESVHEVAFHFRIPLTFEMLSAGPPETSLVVQRTSMSNISNVRGILK